MQKSKFFSLKRIFDIPKMNTKKICAVALLIAVTVVLSAASGYLRLGNIGKISISFVSVFVASFSFGGIVGGLVATLADFVSYIVNPTGAFIPYLTMIEFLFGFLYGLMFYKLGGKHYIISTAVCDIIQLIINLFLKTFVLSFTFDMPYAATLITRVPICLIQFVLVFAVLVIIRPFLNKITYKE